MSLPSADTANHSHEQVAFIGGGNMASAIIGGLLKRGTAASQIQVVEPWNEQRAKLLRQFAGIQVHENPGEALASATLVVWAVKPQAFKDAALQTRFHTKTAVHLSVAAGIRSDSIAHWLDTQRVVRSMPNTPALIGKGVTALFARGAVSAADRLAVERVIRTTGDFIWLDDEKHLDAVTALSGSGPAYVFYFIEAMVQAGVDMGLSHEQAHKLAVGTFVGASELARASDEPPELLRARVTSRGGTTYAALTSMEQDDVKKQFMRAIHVARQRAAELGDEFGAA
ncbi:MAG: pyrroline-5-carboxylate reductase [Pseudomonadota bacterium]|uniref:pyrroline-5-carboxylate reductase n=1 Tax=Polaromonas sp. TaxID=1869339 RepID=UPI0017CCBFEF|nr:pyrroline-5-carboxylate reductase [Polaromonas sp.]MBA3592517.1 pyrroline-5-carboxylate reductase [Polaromonas sp.]MDQ3270620.1 pyrroline-5-carboxylate reductase [Pseudomonadota bacterium]